MYYCKLGKDEIGERVTHAKIDQCGIVLSIGEVGAIVLWKDGTKSHAFRANLIILN